MAGRIPKSGGFTDPTESAYVRVAMLWARSGDYSAALQVADRLWDGMKASVRADIAVT
jgi:hypothetical protein